MSQSHTCDSGKHFLSFSMNSNISHKQEGLPPEDEKKTQEKIKNNNIIHELTKYRSKNMNKIVLATLNINSIRNKFSSLCEIVSNNIDILVIQETKIDATFPTGQFLMPGYKNPYRKDRSF